MVVDEENEGGGVYFGLGGVVESGKLPRFALGGVVCYGFLEQAIQVCRLDAPPALSLHLQSHLERLAHSLSGFGGDEQDGHVIHEA